ncbi:hypothetical protein ACFVHB_25605 [Kitasatospora sp. NPDC127111]|uniref:hypothetical protein n=1 Tax=Kitasatospora sp. NPDC127111 TaxID=3345363 RepID=UPI003626A083
MRSTRSVARRRAVVALLAGAWVVFGGAVLPAAAGGLVPVLDASHLTPLIQADSVLEIDRTANLQFGGDNEGGDASPVGNLPRADPTGPPAPASPQRPASPATGSGG